jgi:hypothetical protein
VLISVYPDRLQRVFPVLFEESLTATQLAGMLLVTVLLAAAGIWLLGRGQGESGKRTVKK